MTRLASTGLAAALFGLAFTSTAVAQTAPDTTPPPMDDPGIDVEVEVDGVEMDGDQHDGTMDHNQPNPQPTTTDTDVDATMSGDGTMMPTPVPPPTDVDITIETPPPPPPTTTGTTGYSAAPLPPTLVYIEEDEADDDSGVLSGIGFAIAAGGGTGGFVNDSLRNTTDVGGEWDVRATIGTRSPIAFEGSYIGSAQSITALGLDSDALLVGNGVQGALRINATLDLPVQPFAFGGAAWRRYELMNTDTNLSDVRDNDDVLELPLGVGIAGKFNGLILDARGEYRFARNADLLPEVTAENLTGDAAAMNRWGVKATLGVEF